MSDETPNPESPPGQLLEPENRGMSRWLLPGALAIGGAALIYKTMSKKKNGKKSPKASSEEVRFGKNYGTYTIGEDWVETVLEPYLAEQSEEESLIVASYFTMHPHTEAGAHTLMNSSRKLVVSAFKNTHNAIGPDDEEVAMSALPTDKSGVQKFNNWLTEQVKTFQENY